jgi:hypothetical protein
MFLLDKALASAVRSGQMDRRELVNDLLRNNNVMELAERLADYVIAYEEPKPIVVSQEEYDRIVSLFKIRGLRADGSIETRGKKK